MVGKKPSDKFLEIRQWVKKLVKAPRSAYRILNSETQRSLDRLFNGAAIPKTATGVKEAVDRWYGPIKELVKTNRSVINEKESYVGKKLTKGDVLAPDKVVPILMKFKNYKRFRIELNKSYNTLRKFYGKITEYIKKEYSKGEITQRIVIFFKDLSSGKGEIRKVTLQPDYFTSYEDFLEILEKLKKGEFITISGTGSDKVDEENYELILNVFDIATYYKGEVDGGGKSGFCKFETLKLGEYEEGFCGLVCLRLLVSDVNLSEEKYKQLELKRITEMVKYIKKVGLPISVIGNTFDVKMVQMSSYKKARDSDNRDIKVRKVEFSEANLLYYHKAEDPIGYIIFDVEKKHYDCTNVLKFKTEYYQRLNASLYCVKDNKYYLLENADGLFEENVDYGRMEPTKVEKKYLLLDFETVVDWDYESVNKPYSLAVYVTTSLGLELLDTIEKENDVTKLEDLIESAHYYPGFDCVAQFEKWVRENTEDTCYVIVTFNGCNYDNFILYNELKKLGSDVLGDPYMAGTRLLNFKWFGCHHMFDIRRHLTGSLKDCCKAFNIKLCAKTSFDHTKAQELYESGELLETIKKDKELRRYNIMDVISLGLLFERYRRSLSSIPGYSDYFQIDDYMTIGMVMTDRLQKYHKDKKIVLPLFHDKKDEARNKRLIQLYNDAMKDKTGGRVDLFNGVLKIENTVLRSLDACSLYPYVMAVKDVLYPCGEIVECTGYKKMPKGLIGFFYCDINQVALKIKIVPEKTKDGNDWHSENVIKRCLISTPKIEFLKKYGAKVKIYEGFYFTETVKSCELFEPLLELMNKKNDQDSFKDSKDARYNSCLRECLKGMQNIVSGKMIEGLHDTKIEYMNENKLVKKLAEDQKKYHILDDSNGSFLVSHKQDQEKIMHKSRPVYIGTLIYDYAHMHMYEHMWTQCPLEENQYGDTDSSKLKDVTFKKWAETYGTRTEVPHWPEVEKYDPRYKTHTIYNPNSKVYGSFEDEYKGLSLDLGYIVQKKGYLISEDYRKAVEGVTFEEKVKIVDKLFEEKKIKFHFKGVRLDDLLLGEDIPEPEDVDHDVEQWGYYKVYNDKRDTRRLKYNLIDLFERLIRGEQVTLLTYSFVRDHKNMRILTCFRKKRLQIKGTLV